MPPTPCEFETTAPGVIRCRRCGTERRTSEPPERYHRQCDAQGLRGVGDLVAAALSAIGIKKQPGCGCQRRQDALNRLFPF